MFFFKSGMMGHKGLYQLGLNFSVSIVYQVNHVSSRAGFRP